MMPKCTHSILAVRSPVLDCINIYTYIASLCRGIRRPLCWIMHRWQMQMWQAHNLSYGEYTLKKKSSSDIITENLQLLNCK